MTVKAKVMAYTVQAYSYYVGLYKRINDVAMPINDTNCSWHIYAVETFRKIIWSSYHTISCY